MGAISKNIKRKELTYSKKLKKFNKAMDKILLSDSKNKNYKKQKNESKKLNNDIKPHLIFTSFETNRRSH